MTSPTLAPSSVSISGAFAVHERRAVLVEALADLKRVIAESEATFDELASTDPTVATARDVTKGRLAIGLATHADVETALRRLDDGTYGLCERCGTAIAVARLEALPYTRHCIACA